MSTPLISHKYHPLNTDRGARRLMPIALLYFPASPTLPSAF